ncbi:T9SS type A sorting domain-containing protein [Constantimarinum furrinae]|uniref:Secretion system C-terminal sorting domain-containing protein n=1 Tax=Constantimarinum furrinae TaxID=2562285 RepID=A0A7G8PSH8_9FLAO|nr:T9SS type A sorting domain-containing protein [Constantimarinum furrinae]QNJ97294.1 hypothetical protein ALE3EI_0717 [Constantimarinum furrinae]
MKMNTVIPFGILFLTLTSLCVGQEIARSTVGASGSSAAVETINGTYIIQESIGQSSVIGTHYSSEVILRQGFIQPPISIQGILADETNIDAVVYPNPFTSSVNVAFREELKGGLSIAIYDLLGRLVYSNERNAEREIRIDLDFLSSAQYILLITSGNKQFKATLLKH